ncbi:uncharacterized protein LOC113684309 [Pocillopora damicornis]|uniref:uncharacterized protein LOC113684309 n=1 Tax=Pocillopora damicornis TaxID=46731 RepID=UPI000F54F64E|nr:uncharacterized protein LOC113684309 [Pocillopora damicornis]
MSIITKHNLTMSGSRIMWVFWFLLNVILITSKASIPSPTEATSLCPCSCDSPLKVLQSYATSYSSSEEGSTSSLHFSSSSTFRSGFYGSSLCYCRCSTTKSTIYEMPHSKSYGSSISVSSFSVYPSSDTHSTYLRFNSGDFSLSQSSSSASTEIRISSSSSERPFSLYPSSSRSGLSFSPTSERSGLSTSPTSAFSITTGDVPLCPCPCQRISKESQASSSLYVYSSDRDRSSQYVVSSFCHCPCKGTSSIHFETSYTASSSSSADASLCTCPCNSVFKDLQSSLPAYATSSKSFSFLIPLSLDNSSSFTKASFSDGSISSKYYLSSSTSSHILDLSSCYCPCSGTPSSVYQTPFSSHAVEEYSCICPCELGLSDSQSSSFLYATTSVVNTSFASRISSSVTKALSNDERNSSQYYSFSSTSSSMPGSPLCYCRCSTASSTVYETSMYSFSSSESLCTCPCGPDSKNLISSSWLHGLSSDARTASQFLSSSSHRRSGISSSFADDSWRDGSSSYLYFLSTASSSISSSLLCYCPCTTTTSTIYQTAFSSSESLCTCPCGPDSRNLKSSSWLHGPSSDVKTASQFLSSSSHPRSGISSSFADDSWRDGSSSYLYFLSSTTVGSSISSSLLCYCPCTTTTSTIYQTGRYLCH